MAKGYYCSKCGKSFKGRAPLKLIANIYDALDKKLGTDRETGDYCKKCGIKVFKSIPWDKD